MMPNQMGLQSPVKKISTGMSAMNIGGSGGQGYKPRPSGMPGYGRALSMPNGGGKGPFPPHISQYASGGMGGNGSYGDLEAPSSAPADGRDANMMQNFPFQVCQFYARIRRVVNSIAAQFRSRSRASNYLCMLQPARFGTLCIAMKFNILRPEVLTKIQLELLQI